MKHIAWDYELPHDAPDERNFYHVFTVSDEAEDLFDDAGTLFYIKGVESPEVNKVVSDFVTAIDAVLDAKK